MKSGAVGLGGSGAPGLRGRGRIPGGLVNLDTFYCSGGKNTVVRSLVQVRANPTASSPPLLRSSAPPLLRPDSRRNAFSVTNSRCFPIVTLPSLSVGMRVCLCVVAGRAVGGEGGGGWRGVVGVRPLRGRRIRSGEKKKGQAADCLELQLISTWPPPLSPSASSPAHGFLPL